MRDKLGLNPLLVCLAYPPEQITQRGVENVSNLIELGFDVVVSSLSPKTWKKSLRSGFFKFTNWARSSELALYSAVPQIALKYGIKIIFWGEKYGGGTFDDNEIQIEFYEAARNLDMDEIVSIKMWTGTLTKVD